MQKLLIPSSHTCGGVDGEKEWQVSEDKLIGHCSIYPGIPVWGKNIDDLSAWLGLAANARHIGWRVKHGFIIIHILQFHTNKSLGAESTLLDGWEVVTNGSHLNTGMQNNWEGS